MHFINSIEILEGDILMCHFNNGILKRVDLKPILDKEAFLPLQDTSNFKRVVNKKYFIEWQGLDIDLSADTLWHWGT